jgi:hypothetical protein
LPEADPSGKATPVHNKRFRVGERPSRDGGLKPFGVAHGIGRGKVEVVVDHPLPAYQGSVLIEWH